MKLNQKKKDKINQWYLNLDDRIKEEILDVIFPDDIIFDLIVSWDRLDWKIKSEVYKENNP